MVCSTKRPVREYLGTPLLKGGWPEIVRTGNKLSKDFDKILNRRTNATSFRFCSVKKEEN